MPRMSAAAPSDNQELYKQIDATCDRLREAGLDAEAKRISYLVHSVAWTSASELFPALGSAFRSVIESADGRNLPQALRGELERLFNTIADH